MPTADAALAHLQQFFAAEQRARDAQWKELVDEQNAAAETVRALVVPELGGIYGVAMRGKNPMAMRMLLRRKPDHAEELERRRASTLPEQYTLFRLDTHAPTDDTVVHSAFVDEMGGTSYQRRLLVGEVDGAPTILAAFAFDPETGVERFLGGRDEYSAPTAAGRELACEALGALVATQRFAEPGDEVSRERHRRDD